MLEEMKGERTWPDVTAYNAVITACEKRAQVEEAVRVFSELRQWHKPDVSNYSASISACGAGGEWGRASLFLEEMKEERTWPDVTTYNAVISACEQGGQVEEALRVFAELRQWHKPNVISYSATISACGTGGEWGRALGVLEEITDAANSPDGTMYGGVTNDDERRGRAEAAEWTLCEV